MTAVRRESTLDLELRNPAFRAAFQAELATQEVSEFVAREMAEKALSVRTLARLASVSPTVVQAIRSGRNNNIEYATLKAIAGALGYKITFTRVQSE